MVSSANMTIVVATPDGSAPSFHVRQAGVEPFHSVPPSDTLVCAV